MKEKIRAHAIILGRVQGVFFRMETKREADKCGVFGWVKNRNDGTVEAVFEGEKGRVASMIEWCKKGPPRSHVTRVDVQWRDAQDEFRRFDIQY